jgi:hypothetical protein
MLSLELHRRPDPADRLIDRGAEWQAGLRA